MHTSIIVNGADFGRDIRIHHNGDWSGNAILQWGSAEDRDTAATIPGWVAKALVRRPRKPRKAKP